MLDKLFLTILKSKWTWIAIAVIAAVVYGYSLYSTVQRLEAEKRQLEQNRAFVADSLSKARDSIQTLAVKVGDLQNESKDWKDKYVATKTQLQIKIDSIRILRAQAHGVTVVGDSIGTVPFDTTVGIARIKGETTVNVKQKTGTYSLSVGFADVEAQSTLFYDATDKLWKMRTLSLSPGVKLRGLTTVDAETFRKISGLSQVVDKTPSIFGVGGLVTTDRVYGGIVLSPSRWLFSIHYKFFDKNDILNERWSDKIMIGVHYFIW